MHLSMSPPYGAWSGFGLIYTRTRINLSNPLISLHTGGGDGVDIDRCIIKISTLNQQLHDLIIFVLQMDVTQL